MKNILTNCIAVPNVFVVHWFEDESRVIYSCNFYSLSIGILTRQPAYQ
jgi:hypothetical protein